MYSDCIYVCYMLRQGRYETVNKKTEKKSEKKDGQLILRLDKDERDEFVKLCKKMDTSASREIRRFIRSFMKENGA